MEAADAQDWDDTAREAMREAERTITWETGLPNVDVRLVHASVTGATIDGYAVTNPVNFQGRHVRQLGYRSVSRSVRTGTQR